MDEYDKNKLRQNIIIAIISGLLLAVAYFNKGKVTNREFFYEVLCIINIISFAVSVASYMWRTASGGGPVERVFETGFGFVVNIFLCILLSYPFIRCIDK